MRIPPMPWLRVLGIYSIGTAIISATDSYYCQCCHDGFALGLEKKMENNENSNNHTTITKGNLYNPFVLQGPNFLLHGPEREGSTKSSFCLHRACTTGFGAVKAPSVRQYFQYPSCLPAFIFQSPQIDAACMLSGIVSYFQQERQGDVCSPHLM